MGIFIGKKIQAFGLDISDSSVKVAQLSTHNNHLQSAVFADVPLLDKVIVNHMIINEERLAGTIMKAIQTAKSIKTKYVVCSVPEAKSFVRLVNIPKMPLSEIEGAIPFELEQDIPIPVDQVYLDWQILGETSENLQLLVTASSKDYIDSLVDTLHSIKLIPVAMEIGAQATARALIGADQQSKSVLIVDIGAQQTSFIIVDQGAPLYTSSLPVAGNAFSDSIARSLNLPFPQADKLKLTTGLLMQTEQGESMRHAILPILDSIIDEIKNIIKFFEDHSQAHHTIQTILLCGGSSRVPGVMEYIGTRINLGSGKTQLSVNVGDPWSNIGAPAAKQPMPLTRDKVLGYSTVIGLSLRGVAYEAE